MPALVGARMPQETDASGARAEAGAPEICDQAAVTVRLVRAAGRPLVWPTRRAT